MNKRPFSRTLAEWITEERKTYSLDLIDLAKNAISDTFACIIAGKGDSATSSAIEYAQRYSSTEANFPVPLRALVYGVAGHALDYDDNFYIAFSHPSTVLVPAIFSLAEDQGMSGEDIIDAYITGIEVQARIGQVMNPSHYAKGWHGTSTNGLLGASAACARLMKLDTQTTLGALGLATSMVSGSKKQFGTPAKPFHAGMAAERAISATYLAMDGFYGDEEPIAGKWGFHELFDGRTDADFDEALQDLGNENFALATTGVLPKRFACCGSTHGAMDGVLEIMEEHSLSKDNIEKIETFVSRIAFNNLSYSEPKNEMEARFSMNYCIALLLEYGKTSLEDFTQEATTRPELKQWLPKVKMSVRTTPCPDKSFFPTIVHIHLKDGSVLEKEIYDLCGSIEKPFSIEDRENKFMDCASMSKLSNTDAQEFFGLLENLHSLKSLQPIEEFLQKA